MKKFLVVSIFILVAHIRLVAQKDSTALWAKKSLSATNITQSITIDGELNEAEWASAQAASDFVINQPNTGAAATHRSDVRVLYDNQALYIGALLYDIHPDSIYPPNKEAKMAVGMPYGTAVFKLLTRVGLLS